jgi:glycosyltransferase involved in cell wall biosynthesis
MAIDYSVIIPAYNEEALLPQTLGSLKTYMSKTAGYVGEIIVVDNESTDRTAEVAASLGARVIHEPHRQIAKARNTGGEHAEGRYLIFLDADTMPTDGLLEATLRALESGDVVGGGTRVDAIEKLSVVMRLVLWCWKMLSVMFHWAAGSYVYCLKEAFDDVNGFDEDYYASEEIWFSKRLKRWGRKHKKKMKILDIPVRTSMRKVDWHSGLGILWSMVKLGLVPGSLKSREACKFWYERPESAEKNDK